MIEIGNLIVQESWTEYAVQLEPDFIVDCDNRAEAELIVSRNADARLVIRHGYLTEWCDV